MQNYKAKCTWKATVVLSSSFRPKQIKILYNFKEILNSQIMWIHIILYIERLKKCYILNIW